MTESEHVSTTTYSLRANATIEAPMYPYPMTGFSFFEETHVWTDGFWGTMGVPEKTISVTFKDTTALLPQNQSTQKLHVFVGESQLLKFSNRSIRSQDIRPLMIPHNNPT